jgi:hypothetical protein
MAKKRRKEEVEEEKYEFKPPDFDEKTFLATDLKGTKTVIVSSFVGVLAGILAWALTGISALLGGLIILAAAFGLSYIFKVIRIDAEGIQRMTKVGNSVLVIFLGLALWIVLLNPPATDLIPPRIAGTAVEFHTPTNSTWVMYSSDVSPIHSGYTVRVSASVNDNGRIANVYIEIPGATSGQVSMTLERGNYTFSQVFTTPNTYSYTITAVDGAGNEKVANGSFIVIA